MLECPAPADGATPEDIALSVIKVKIHIFKLKFSPKVKNNNSYYK